MRVLQLIDSLQTGGAERVAVNIANTLSKEIEYSSICVTRKEGALINDINEEVDYFFLNKKKTIDFKAVKRLNAFVKKKNIQIIHAHSSSFFYATIIKLLNKSISIIWHDHYGDSEFLKNRKYSVLKICSKYFSHVFSVNEKLEIWAKDKLKLKNVSYLPNFAVLNRNLEKTILKGEKGKRIICLANLRPQKDHITLFDAFKIVNKSHPDWTLHCVGKKFNDEYSKKIENKIKALNLEKFIFLYDSKPDVYNVLIQCEIGVLSSKSEGLPIALLEYGLANLAVIATKVGENNSVITNNVNGLLVNPSSAKELAKAVTLYIENEVLRKKLAKKYITNITENYSDKAQIKTILKIYKIILK